MEPPANTAPDTILLIDDEIALLDVNRRGLTTLGYRVLTAPGGEEGLAVLRQQPVDLVVLDMLMPRMDGVETLRRIRAEFPDQNVVILSAYAERERVEAVNALGIRGYLKKPISLKTLAATLRKALAGETDLDLELD
jgi:CheY-like chemotaxis protein